MKTSNYEWYSDDAAKVGVVIRLKDQASIRVTGREWQACKREFEGLPCLNREPYAQKLLFDILASAYFEERKRRKRA